MVHSSTPKKTHSTPKRSSSSATRARQNPPKQTVPLRNSTNKSAHKPQNVAKHSSASSKSRISKQHTAEPDGFVINHQKNKLQKVDKTKVKHAKSLVFLVGIGVIAIGVILAVKFSQSTYKTAPSSQSDTSVSSTISKPKSADPREEVSALAQAQSRVSSIRSMLEQTSFSPTTVVKLKVPLYKQTYGQSCEASALRMALAYRGIATTDMAILDQMGYDGRASEVINGQLTWGDPHKQYVGEKDGDQTNLTGYGVFGEPVVAATEKNGRMAEVKDDVKVDWITQQLYAGNPVILWGVSIKIDDGVWQTSDGTTITAPRRTHTRLVVGFSGDPKAPTGFYINDPATGVEKYWKTAVLETNISQGIKQAVAVY